MRVLITGNRGYVGAAVTKYLKKKKKLMFMELIIIFFPKKLLKTKQTKISEK